MANKTLHSNTNTITRGYAGGGSSISYRREYTRQVSAINVISHGFPKGAHGEIKINITFSMRTSSKSILMIMIPR